MVSMVNKVAHEDRKFETVAGPRATRSILKLPDLVWLLFPLLTLSQRALTTEALLFIAAYRSTSPLPTAVRH